MLKKKIFTPGPTQVHPDVLKASISFSTYHRSAEFKSFYFSLIKKLRSIFLTQFHINILTTSGTGAMEAAAVNFCEPGENVLFINQGRFGARWGAICRAHGINAAELQIEYGKSALPEDLEKVNFENLAAVFFTHTETSTAALTDLKKLTAYVKERSNALNVVDAITSVGAVEFRMDDWKIDAAVSASQKGLMTQPGIAVIAFNDAALEKAEKNATKRFFFDLRKEFVSMKEFGLPVWTPAVGLFYGLDKACDLILTEGLENRWYKTFKMADYFRKKVIKNGMGLFSQSPSNSLTAVTFPDKIKSGDIIKAMHDNYGIQIANGQAELKDKIARVSHMGDLELEDIQEFSDLFFNEVNQLKVYKY